MESKVTNKEFERLKTTDLLFKKSPIVRFIWKNQDTWPVEFVSENVKNIFGFSPDDFLTHKIVYSSIIHTEDLLEVTNEVDKNSQNNSNSFEHKPYRIICKNGAIKWIKDITLIQRNENNEITHYEGIIFDITKQIITEKTLKENENYLIALNKASVVFSKGDIKNQIKEFIKIIGKVAHACRTYIFKNHKDENGDFLLSQIAEYVAKDIKPEIDNPQLQNLSYNDWLPRWYKTLSEGEIISSKISEFPQSEKDILEPQDIKAILIIPIIIDKQFWGFIGFDNCINEQEWKLTEIEFLKASAEKISYRIKEGRKQQMLENENKRFRTTMDAIDAVVYVADMETYELLFLNKKGKQLTGTKIGQKCYNALQQGQSEPCSFCTNHLLLNEKGEPKEPYLWEFKNTVTKQWYLCRDQAIHWTNNKLVRIEIATDITELKKNEQALKESEAELRKSNNTKDKFFSIIAHDLKSPFNSLLGFSNILNEGYERYDIAKQKKFLGIIHNGIQNTYKLLENLLLWSRSQQGSIDFKLEKINLYSLCKEVGKLLIQAAMNKSIEIINDIPENISVEADKNMLSTIFRNLISNAIKFTQKNGRITINARLITDKDKNLFTEIIVKDSGVGISKSNQLKLFNIGENKSTKGTKNEKGTGLGLILCKEFVEKHKGTIRVESEIDEGSSFYFTIPTNSKIDIENTFNKQNKFTILIVEDEEINYLYLEAIIEELDIVLKTFLAKDGRKAIEICEENPDIDLVLMDIKMPIMDGYKATTKIKEFRPNLPIIAQTAYSTKEYKDRAFSARCDDFISKPISEKTLINIINKYLIIN